MEKSIAEILDGYSIALIKDEKIHNDMTSTIVKNYQIAVDQIKIEYPDYDWNSIIKSFVDVNSTIWKYESGIRQGLLDDDPMAVFTRAILVREFNQLRVGIGNLVSILLKQNEVLNLKKDHVSA